MKNQADYSQYKCPYSHIKKECGHELHGPEGYENTFGIWCACGFRGPVFCLDPEELGLVMTETEGGGYVKVEDVARVVASHQRLVDASRDFIDAIRTPNLGNLRKMNEIRATFFAALAEAEEVLR